MIFLINIYSEARYIYIYLSLTPHANSKLKENANIVYNV